MDGIFLDITVVIGVAAFLSIVFRFFNQPAILAYVLTGILLGPIGLFHIHDNAALQTLGDLGITLLLFMLGLELKVRELQSIGKTAVILGILQIWFTFVIGFFISFLLHFSSTESLFIGIATAFSSTVIVVKVFSDKKDLNSLHGKLAVGVLLVQDFVAILLLIFLSSGAPFTGSLNILVEDILILLIKIGIIFAIIIFLSYKVFPSVTRLIARSPESLFLCSLAWVFVVTAVVSSQWIGFSTEIGGFLAGLALANTNENFQIVSRMRALRDFFITIFFVMLGLQMSFQNVWVLIPQAIILSIFVLVLKPLIVIVFTNLFGFRKRTSFLVGVSLGQVSEFSFLLIFLASKLGYVSSDVVTLVVLVGLISFAFSTYAMQSSSALYRLFLPLLDRIELEGVHALHIDGATEEEVLSKLKNHLVIIGGHQMGQSILRSLEKDQDVVVVDFDPDVVKRLREKKILSFFGDIADPEIQERARLDQAKLVVSTVPDIEDNLRLIERLNQHNRRAKIVVMAYEMDDAKQLYKAGADYVVLPHLAGGRLLAKILKDEDLSEIEKYKKKDLEFEFA